MSRKSKILVVDDDPFSLDLLRQELEHLGHEINTCTNGKKAIEEDYQRNLQTRLSWDHCD